MEFLHEFLDARFVGAVKDFARAVQREGVQSTGPAAASTLYTPPQDVLASVMAATKALNITSTRISTDNLPAPASRAPSVPRKRPREGELHSPPSAKKRTDYDGHSSSFFDRSGHTRDFQVPSSRVGSSAYSLALSQHTEAARQHTSMLQRALSNDPSALKPLSAAGATAGAGTERLSASAPAPGPISLRSTHSTRSNRSVVAHLAKCGNPLREQPMERPPMAVLAYMPPGTRRAGNTSSSYYVLEDGHVVRAVRCSERGPRWTQLHDDILREAVAELTSYSWPAVADAVTARSEEAGAPLPVTPNNVKARCVSLMNGNRRKGPWTAQEDRQLMWIMSDITDRIMAKDPIMSRHLKHIQWADVSYRMFWRTGKQCRDRWLNNLDPTIKRYPFTREELSIMNYAFQKLGKRWTDIAAQLDGRTENQVKNYMFSRQRAEKRRSGAFSSADAASAPMSMDTPSSAAASDDEGSL